MLHRLLCVLACVFTLAAGAVQAQAQFPSKPIRLIVPFAPGGSTDVMARLVAEEMRADLGQPVIVENRPGAAGNVGGDYVAKSPADGYTVLVAAAGPIGINPSLYPAMPFSPTKDLRPVTMLANEANILAVHPNVPARTVQEFVAWAKANPGKASFGSAGGGTPGHLGGEWFNQLTGTKMIHVPYKGTGPAVNDLLGGQIVAMIDNMLPLWPHVQAGRLRALAVSTAKRWPSAPELPTMTESGVKGFEINVWKGLMVPAATPAPVVSRLHEAAVRALANSALRKRLRELGAEPVGNKPEEFAQVIQKDIGTWATLVKSTGATVD
jgi:tripartite-type tricarboxylate transporter receptor subunit TctC